MCHFVRHPKVGRDQCTVVGIIVPHACFPLAGGDFGVGGATVATGHRAEETAVTLSHGQAGGDARAAVVAAPGPADHQIVPSRHLSSTSHDKRKPCMRPAASCAKLMPVVCYPWQGLSLAVDFAAHGVWQSHDKGEMCGGASRIAGAVAVCTCSATVRQRWVRIEMPLCAIMMKRCMTCSAASSGQCIGFPYLDSIMLDLLRAPSRLVDSRACVFGSIGPVHGSQTIRTSGPNS